MRAKLNLPAICAGLGVLAGTPAMASVSTFTAGYSDQYQAFIPGSGYTGSNYGDTLSVHAGTATRQFSSTDTFSGSTGTGSVLSIAGAGIVKLSIDGSSTTSTYGENGALHINANADLDDFFTPSTGNSADIGKLINITASFNLSGSMSASENGNIIGFGNYATAEGNTFVSASGTGMQASPYTDGSFGRVDRRTGESPVDEPLISSVLVTLQGHIGTEMEMLDHFTLGGLGSSTMNQSPVTSVTGTFSSDLSHTIAWGGVSSATDANGIAFQNLSLFSANTGFDYVHAAVPEPSTYLAMALGLSGLLGFRRRRPTH